MRSAFLVIDYVEFEEGNYKRVYARISGTGIEISCSTKNVVEDFKNVVDIILELGYQISYSSTVDNFMGDNKDKYRFESPYLVENET